MQSINIQYLQHTEIRTQENVKVNPSEFQEWGMTKYRNLFLGHLHTGKSRRR